MSISLPRWGECKTAKQRKEYKAARMLEYRGGSKMEKRKAEIPSSVARHAKKWGISLEVAAQDLLVGRVG